MSCRGYIMLVLLLPSSFHVLIGRGQPHSKQLDYPPVEAKHTASVDQKDVDRYYLAPLTKKITPETTVFAFDLHDVIFEKISGEMVGHSLRVVSRGMFWYLFNPFFWYTARKISTQTAIWEDFFNQLVEKYPGLKRFEKDFYAVANAQKPIQPMVDIIMQLHAQKYKLYILSNIGGKTFTLFKQKFPELFSYFSGAYTPCKENNYNCKPNMSFYTEFKEQLCASGDSGKQCIFIDDLEINLQAALASNKLHNEFIMAGVHCTSVDRVKTVLQDMGVLDPKEIQTEISEKVDRIVENV